MTTDTKTEEGKPEVSIQMTSGLMRLKINTEITKHKLTIADIRVRAEAIVKNEDGLKAWADLLKDTKKVRDLAETIHETTKKPFLEGGRACDAGKKLVLNELVDIEGLFPNYQQLLANAAEKKRLADLKIATDVAIKKGIEDNLIVFSNRIIAAVTRKALSEVESLINLQKSPSMAKKYGEFHQLAIARYDEVLIPVIKDQKAKIAKLEGLNTQLLAAEANNDPDMMDLLDTRINDLSNEILQNHAELQDAVLNQESFPVLEATEVLPEFKNKRTNYTYEIADVEVALKKSRDLLEITIDNKKAKLVKDKLIEEGLFEGKDEVIKDGIKYIATKVREAL